MDLGRYLEMSWVVRCGKSCEMASAPLWIALRRVEVTGIPSVA